MLFEDKLVDKRRRMTNKKKIKDTNKSNSKRSCEIGKRKKNRKVMEAIFQIAEHAQPTTYKREDEKKLSSTSTCSNQFSMKPMAASQHEENKIKLTVNCKQIHWIYFLSMWLADMFFFLHLFLLQSYYLCGFYTDLLIK